MASFDLASAITLNLEGSYGDDPNDNGCYYPQNKDTGVLIGCKFGITPMTYYDFYKKIPTIDDMKNLTIEQAKSIYKKKYWDNCCLDYVNNQSIANIIFDTSINTYWANANKGVRFVLGLGNSIIVNPTIIASVNTSDQSTFFSEYKQWRINFYKNAKPVEYRDKWIARTNKFVFVP